MNEINTTLILKKAVILEQQGFSFYKNAAAMSSNSELIHIFATMAAEEKNHSEILLNQLQQLEHGKEEPINLTNIPDEFTDAVLTDRIVNTISAASYEAAAISAAMGLEIQTVNLYENSADSAKTPEEEKLFRYLSNWESTHLKVLSNLNRKILERALQDDIY
ncbi:MAG TPA: hypothetical protein DCO79_16685 [Spirochaeta sp.]|nr:hypothetical protein [Spirochaeta sp.]